ncbi:MAG: dienelactone hydrolase family protein [Ilumatobacteraceae bacterium]
MTTDVLADFSTREFTALGKQRTVYELGEGPAVVVIAEMPGITPAVVEFARRVAAIGCTAVLPHLFGEPGRSGATEEEEPAGGRRLRPLVLPGVRVAGSTSWRQARRRPSSTGCLNWRVTSTSGAAGTDVGAVGMCFTGGFALAMATDDRLLAPVVSQPSLPFGVTKRHRATIDISASDLAAVKQRCDAGLEVIGLRFTGDRLVPGERFEFLRRELGDAFVAIELPDRSANPDALMSPHSVLTEHLIDADGEPTREALDRVLELFRSRLLGTG